MPSADTCPTCKEPWNLYYPGSNNRAPGIHRCDPRQLLQEKDDQIAVLVEAAIQPRPNGHKWCALCGMWAQKDQEIDHSRTCVLADLPAAARERATEASPQG